MTPRTRFTAAVYLILVFASGILVGVVSHRLYVTTSVAANSNPPRTMEQYRKQFLGEMQQKIGANDQQVAQINQILDDTKRKLDEQHAKEKPVHEKLDQDRISAIRAVLNDQQKTAYDNWRLERARQSELKKKQKK